MPKIAIINDIHCNYLTLKKALNYLKDKNIDKYIICGDSITDGYENNLVIDTIKKLNPIIINGNRELSIINYNGRDWQNSVQYASMHGIDYCNDFIKYLNKHYKIIDNNTWKIGFPKYMAEKQLDIF